jgi:hypothetical protein
MVWWSMIAPPSPAIKHANTFTIHCATHRMVPVARGGYDCETSCGG